MVKIVLSTGELDVAENVSLPITFNIGDIRDLTSRKGTFSKTVVLEGTKNNNELLGHYYDVNIQAGTFNINTLTKCQVIQNGVPILDEALLQLVSVNKVQANNSYEDEVSYSVLIKDSRAEFFTAITNANLTDLDFSDLNHIFDATGIVSSFANTVVDGYKYVMPYNDTNSYVANEFKPGIYAKTYFDRIFAVAGFTYTWSELATAHFDKLIIPYNGDTNNQSYEDYRVEATNTWTTTNVQATGYNLTFQEAVNSGWSEVIDSQGIFNPSTGQYTSPFSTNAIGGESYTYNLSIGGTISLDNTSGAIAWLSMPSTFTHIYNRYRVFAVVNVAGLGNVIVYGANAVVRYTSLAPLANGSTTILSIAETLSLPAVVNGTSLGITSGDIQILNIGVEVKSFQDLACTLPMSPIFGTNGQVFTQAIFPYNYVPVNVVLDLTTINMVVLPSSNIQVSGSTLVMNEFVPVEVKQSDFVKAIIQMYNLYVEQDVDNPYNLILRHRDEYYDSGAEKDWSEKLAKDRAQELVFLPDLTKKKLKLTYAPDEDSPNVAYTQATNEIYGQIEYTFDNEYVKDVDTKELLFSPTPVYRTVFGAYVPNIAGLAPNINIRILYDGGVGTCQSYDIVEFGTTGEFGLINYPMIGHFNDPIYPTFDINFGTNDYYFYEVGSLTNNNLYNLYWRRTVNQINVGKMLIAFFDLDEVDIQSLKLNDRIYIDNSWWNINKVSDYNANNNQLTKVELISVDTEIDLATFQTGNGNPIGDTITAVGLDSVLRSMTANGNVIMPGADVVIRGRGNTVPAGVRGMIVGDGQVLEEDGMVVSNLTVTGTINGEVQVSSTKYIATLLQSSTTDPLATVLENTLGDIVWTRFAVGVYRGTLSGAFPDQDRTYVVFNNTVGPSACTSAWKSVNEIEITTYDIATSALADDLIGYSTIEIRTY
jgi:hypothetical protein